MFAHMQIEAIPNNDCFSTSLNSASDVGFTEDSRITDSHLGFLSGPANGFKPQGAVRHTWSAT
jgi:hypothetical protein